MPSVGGVLRSKTPRQFRKAELPAHGYTLYKRRHVKRLRPQFPLFNHLFSLERHNTLGLRQNTALSLDNKPPSLDNKPLSLDNNSLSLDFTPKPVDPRAFWGKNSLFAIPEEAYSMSQGSDRLPATREGQ
ncbi:MAG: hypothetical protein LBU25_09085, partial [Treponema sp.]|nr:hypothetical protein [Treponema sp.]